MTLVTSDDAERVLDHILPSNDDILAISVMDMRGNILAIKSKEIFREAFQITDERRRYGGTLAVSMLSLVNEARYILEHQKL